MKSISFSPPMMRALLEGRKTQTRRIHANGKGKFEVGDLVWVKEGLEVARGEDALGSQVEWVAYECGDKLAFGDFALTSDGFAIDWPWSCDKLPAMFCPRWASRVTLRITRVREENLWAISDGDALAEGFQNRAEFIEYFQQINPAAKCGQRVFAYDFEVVK